MRKYFAVLLCFIMIFSFAACGGETGDNGGSEEPASYAGTYVETVAGRGVITIEEFDGKYDVVIEWPNSASEVIYWNFSGDFDENGVLEYNDCQKLLTTYKEDGSNDTLSDYADGTGRLRMTDEGLLWEDDQENVAEGSVFALQ